MKKYLNRFLKVSVLLIGASTLAFLLIMPHFEGRNLSASWSEIYFKDPFLAFAYFASIPFFIILYQSYKILNSKLNKQSLKIIKYCATSNIPLVIIGEIWIAQNVGDDKTGGFFMGFLITLVSLLIIITAQKLDRTIKKS